MDASMLASLTALLHSGMSIDEVLYRGNPYETMQKAKQGYTEEMAFLNTIWKEIQTQPGGVKKKRSDGFSYEKLLDVFLTVLGEASKVPKQWPPKDRDENDWIFSSLMAMTCVGSCDREALVPYHSRLLKIWKTTCKWAKYTSDNLLFQKNSPADKKLGHDVGKSVATSIGAMWDVYLPIDHNLLRTTPGMLELVYEIFTYDWTKKDLDVRVILLPSVFSLNAIQGRDQLAARMVKASGGEAKTIGAATLSVLEYGVDGGFPEDVFIAACGQALMISGLNGVMKDGFLDAGGIKTISKALYKLSSIVIHQRNPDEDILVAAQTCIVYLADCGINNRIAGFRWAIGLFNGNFLTSWLRFSPHFRKMGGSQFMQKRVYDVINHFLPMLMCYRSVIRISEKAIIKAQKKTEGMKFPEKADKAWTTFVVFAAERAKIANSNHMKGMKNSAKKWGSCDNDECPIGKDEEKAKATTFFRCARCHAAMYCSRECQSIAWKTQDHKKDCKIFTEHGFDRYRDTFVTQSDNRFTRYLALYLCTIELGNLRDMAKRQFPACPLSDLVVNVSFVEYEPDKPVTFSLQRFSDFNPSMEPASNARQKAYLKDQARDLGEGTVFNIIAPQTANHSMNFTGVVDGKSFWEGGLFMPDFKKMSNDQILDFGKGVADIWERMLIDQMDDMSQADMDMIATLNGELSGLSFEEKMKRLDEIEKVGRLPQGTPRKTAPISPLSEPPSSLGLQSRTQQRERLAKLFDKHPDDFSPQKKAPPSNAFGLDLDVD